MDNIIEVSLEPGESDVGNNFVDSNRGSISGTVTCQGKGDFVRPLAGVKIELLAENEVDIVATTTTDENGIYSFLDVSPAIYFVNESNSEECPNNVLDQDNV